MSPIQAFSFALILFIIGATTILPLDTAAEGSTTAKVGATIAFVGGAGALIANSVPGGQGVALAFGVIGLIGAGICLLDTFGYDPLGDIEPPPPEPPRMNSYERSRYGIDQYGRQVQQ